MKAPTIYDVAARAGVSHQTVTRYLNGFEGIREETKSRVADALQELDYRPNFAARMLRSRRGNRIAVLAQDLDQSGPAKILAGATREAQRWGYVLDVVSLDGNDPESVDRAIEVVREHQVSGLLTLAQTEVVLDRLNKVQVDIPTISDTRVTFTPGGPSANEISGGLAAEHLWELGHRHIGYLSGPSNWIAGQDRRRGFQARLEQLGGTAEWVREGDWSAGSGHHAWTTLSPSECTVTAVASANDTMLIGLISAMAKDGKRVPEDISVIGTDDLPESQFLLPPLSTVALDFEGEGEHAIRQLLELLTGPAPPAEPEEPWAPHLVARESTSELRTTP